MKISVAKKISPWRNGATLIECLVYIAVFSVVLGGAMAAFYYSWDHTRATIFTVDEISSTLRVGEVWRADVRAATEKIILEANINNEIVKFSENGKEIIYRWTDGELRREIPAQNISRVLLPKVKMSAMTAEIRNGVTAWRWELEAIPRRKEAQLPLRFTFEAAQIKP